MEMFNYYTLDECIDKSSVFEKLNDLKKEGKITYSVEGEVLKINDIDLEENDIEELTEVFENNDVFLYLDRDEDEDEDGGFGNYYDDEEEDY
jgi:hypothetical protein